MANPAAAPRRPRSRDAAGLPAVTRERIVEAALLRHRHRLNEAAADLGISRVTLYRLMGAHGLRDEKTIFGGEAENQSALRPDHRE